MTSWNLTNELHTNLLLTNQINLKEERKNTRIRNSSQLIFGWPKRRNTNSITITQSYDKDTLDGGFYLHIHLKSYTPLLRHFKHNSLNTLFFTYTHKKKWWWIRNYVLCHYVMCSLLAIALQVIVLVVVA